MRICALTTAVVLVCVNFGCVAFGQLDQQKAMTQPLQDDSGKRISLSLLSKSKPIVVLAVNKTCPHMPEAVKVFNQLSTSAGKEIEVVGLINGSATEAANFRRTSGCKFRVVGDLNLNVIRGLGFERGGQFLVAQNGRVLKRWQGYGVASINETIKLLAERSGAKPWSPPSGLSERPKAGCGF